MISLTLIYNVRVRTRHVAASEVSASPQLAVAFLPAGAPSVGLSTYLCDTGSIGSERRIQWPAGWARRPVGMAKLAFAIGRRRTRRLF